MGDTKIFSASLSPDTTHGVLAIKSGHQNMNWHMSCRPAHYSMLAWYAHSLVHSTVLVQLELRLIPGTLRTLCGERK